MPDRNTSTGTHSKKQDILVYFFRLHVNLNENVLFESFKSVNGHLCAWRRWISSVGNLGWSACMNGRADNKKSNTYTNSNRGRCHSNNSSAHTGWVRNSGQCSQNNHVEKILPCHVNEFLSKISDGYIISLTTSANKNKTSSISLSSWILLTTLGTQKPNGVEVYCISF